MAVARFSPFEALLLKSQNQRQSAELLLLAWVFVNKHEALDEDRRYLETLGKRCHRERDLVTLMEIARRTDLGDIQLAAEVLARDSAETASLFLRQAIALATSDGELSLRNHHILRFLADLIRVMPEDLSRWFLEVTGRQLQAPPDPSRRSYWASIEEDAETIEPQEEAPAPDNQEAPRSASRPGWRQRAREMADRQWQQRQQRQRRRDQERQQAQQERLDAETREKERQARADQERAKEQARQRREEQRRRQDQAHAEAAFHAPYRFRMALIELELEANASPVEIKRAYRRLAQRHHPDRFHGQSEWRLKLASQRFQRIQNAYELLMQHA
ncbi:J domain-containing protein [Salinicola socius]|uniref:J domain-containing protein n=1 Tax=Salinicola socius TaxID=404433 RepID=UPI000DA1515F|nr:J domain-containing protein [Salinicola socius]